MVKRGSTPFTQELEERVRGSQGRLSISQESEVRRIVREELAKDNADQIYQELREQCVDAFLTAHRGWEGNKPSGRIITDPGTANILAGIAVNIFRKSKF